MSSCVYRCFGADDEVIYIVYTEYWKKRHQVHRSATPWWSEVARVELTICDDRAHAQEMERVLISAELPQHNINIKRRAEGVKKLRDLVASAHPRNPRVMVK